MNRKKSHRLKCKINKHRPKNRGGKIMEDKLRTEVLFCYRNIAG